MSTEGESVPQKVVEDQVEESKSVEQPPVQEVPSAAQQAPKKNKYLKQNFLTCQNYEDVNMIAEAIPSLESLKAPLEIEKIENAHCYVIRSNNDEDVHKAIKYGIWTSVPGNNVKLNLAYQNAQEKGVEVYLFFSVVKSGQFNGVARLKSAFQEETFSYWGQPHKFKGHFKVEWVFVKNVKQKSFEGLKNSQGDDISRSKDCTELNFEETGRKMLQTFKEAPSSPSIFKTFAFFDADEQEIRRHYKFLGNQQNQNRQGQQRNGNNQMYPGQGYHPFYNLRFPQAHNQQQHMNGQQYQMPIAFYQNLFAQQLMQQNSMAQYYSQEQLNTLQNMCATHIYPPNTSFQQNPQQGGKNHSNNNTNANNNNNNNGQGRRGNNQTNNGNNGRKQRNQRNEKPNSNQGQQKQQGKEQDNVQAQENKKVE